MPEPSTPQQNFSTADLQTQLDTLKQENVRLRSQFQACEQSQLKLQSDLNGSALEYRLLAATATAANVLLTIAPFDEAVNTALQIMGEVLEADRVDIIENFTHPTDLSLRWRLLYEWNSPGTMSQLAHPGASQGTYEGIEEWGEQLSQGQSIGYLLEDMPEPFRSGQAELEVKALHVVPIFIEKKWWGIIGFDDCREVKRRSPSELAVLKIAADCIGSAIERERNQQALLEAEQARSQQLERHNTELQHTIAQLAESEERFRTLFELSSEGFYYTEVDPPCPVDLPIEEQFEWLHRNIRVVKANPAFAAMYGIENPDKLIGLKNADVHVPGSEKNAAFIRGIIENGYCCRNLETEEIDSQGRLHYFLNSGVCTVRDGYVLSAWATQTDITELRQAQQALLQAEQARSTELEKLNEELQQRDRLLSTVAAVSKDLLESSEVDTTIAQAMQRIGKAAGISRITLMQEKREAGSERLQHHVIQEWTDSSVPRQMDDPATQIMYNDEYGVLVNELHAGRSIWYTLEVLPEPVRTQQAAIEVKSTGAVPIFIEGAYFGCVAFDDCIDYRQWSTQEIDVLTSGAGVIGAALHRKQLVDRLIAERIQAEQERVAELAKANEALKRSLDILAADPDLDRFIGHTLKVIADQFDSPLTEHWSHAKQSNMTHVTLICWHGQILRPMDQSEHPGLIGIPIPSELRHNKALERRQRHILYQGIGSETDEIGKQISAQVGFDVSAWYTSRGVTQFLNIPLNVGDTTIGALAIYLPSDRSFPEQTIELAHAFAQQLALAIQLTQLAEEAKQAAILEERNRMARDIHDALAQSFTGIIMQLEAVRGDTPTTPDGMQIRLDRISDLARLGLAEARRSVQALRPQALEAANFADALRYLLHQMTHNTPICATLNVEGTPYPLLDRIEENLLRVAQEALTNAIRHGQAHTITLQLLFEGAAVHLQVRDDGNGFDPHKITPTGFGLAGMQERTRHLNGHFHLISHPGQGTEITITVPMGL